MEVQVRDLELIDLLATKLEQASAAAGWNYAVIQTSGPTQQGIPDAPIIMFQKLFDEPRGWPKSTSVYEPVADQFTTKSLQEYQTTFQISALVIQVPDDLTLPTASDVANYMYNALHSRSTVSAFMKVGVNVMRAPQIGNAYFEDDRSRFEARPSFDIILTHSREVGQITPAVHVVEGEEHAGFVGKGTFPV
jgi:hypothetical protein